MKDRFSRLEARVEALVEGTFARLFAGSVHPRDVAVQLARALEDSTLDGSPATHYAVHLNPADAQTLLAAHPDLADTLSAEVLNLARQSMITLPEEPLVRLVADDAQKPHTVLVTAQQNRPGHGTTQTMAAVRESPPQVVPKAWLIIDGDRTVLLAKPVVKLGRRFDNDVVVDDLHVSREHAQLRLRFGHYAVYDLGSTGGTFVNGQRVEECVLRAGDVISLGGIPLIYGEDAGTTDRPRGSVRQTLPFRPTRPLKPSGPDAKPDAKRASE